MSNTVELNQLVEKKEQVITTIKTLDNQIKQLIKSKRECQTKLIDINRSINNKIYDNDKIVCGKYKHLSNICYQVPNNNIDTYIKLSSNTLTTMPYFEMTSDDMDKIKQVLKISIGDLETIVKSVIRYNRVNIKSVSDFQIYTTGDIYNMLSGYGYVMRLLDFVTDLSCNKCGHISYTNHRCYRQHKRYVR